MQSDQSSTYSSIIHILIFMNYPSLSQSTTPSSNTQFTHPSTQFFPHLSIHLSTQPSSRPSTHSLTYLTKSSTLLLLVSQPHHSLIHSCIHHSKNLLTPLPFHLNYDSLFTFIYQYVHPSIFPHLTPLSNRSSIISYNTKPS